MNAYALALSAALGVAGGVLLARRTTTTGQATRTLFWAVVALLILLVCIALTYLGEALTNV